jgi:hypothetical protein
VRLESFDKLEKLIYFIGSRTRNLCCCLSTEGRPLWSSGQSPWLQIERSGFSSWGYRIFLEIVGLERGPLSLVSTIEERSCSALEIREYGSRDPSR